MGRAAKRQIATAALAAVLLICTRGARIHAQERPQSPGPYVVDVRGLLIAIPGDPEFYPAIAETIIIPTRGFGIEVGAHVYPLSIGPARIGIGAGIFRGRGTAPGAATLVSGVAPQLSFNFGTRDGWSYLSGGYGPAELSSDLPASGDTGAATGKTGTLRAFNVGGGARWFLRRRLGVGFDLRFYGVGSSASAGTPSVTLFAASAGFSVR